MSSKNNEMLPSDLMEALLKDPVKKALLLQLITQEKDGFEAYKQRELNSKPGTPLKKLKKTHFESPTALQRRRGLEQLKRDSTSESSSSEQSENSEVKGPKLPFDQLLKGVRAYVEVKRNNTDRSEGIKAVMKLMGATVKDQFTNDVTHVVFKDGSFTTYQKAKLLKVHLVSVLWIDAVRRNSVRVPEKNYPAFGSNVCDNNVSILCSQLQKDYEDIIKDEKRRSMSALPKASTSILNDNKYKRRTVMTSQSSVNSQLISKSFNRLISDDDSEKNSSSSERREKSPDITSDDSDCGMIDGVTSKRSKENIDLVQSSIVDDSVIEMKDASKNSLESSSASKSLFNLIKTKNNRKTVNVISDMIITPNIENAKSLSVDEHFLQISSDKSTNISKSINDLSDMDITPNIEDNKKNNLRKILQDSTIHLSKISSDSDQTKSGLLDNFTSKTASLNEAQTSIMSSLRLSSDDKIVKSTSDKENRSVTSIKTSMSSLRVSENSLDKNAEPEKNVRKRRSRSVISKSDTNSTNSLNQRASSVCSRTSLKQKLDKNENIGKSKRLSSVSSQNLGKNANKSVAVESTRRNTRSLSKSRKSDRKFNSSESLSSDSELQPSPQKTQTPSPVKKSRVENTPKKTRRLYNPTEFVNVLLSQESQDDEERNEYRKNKTKKETGNVFVNPNNLKITPFKSKIQSKKNSLEIIEDSQETEKKKKKITRKVDKTPVRDSSADEQRELLDLLTNKTGKEVRRSERLNLSQPNSKSQFSLNSTESGSNLPITPIKRRSTLDFQISQSQSRRKPKLSPRRSIVCTKFHRNEVQNFVRIVRTLGEFFVEDEVSDKTTHLVAGEVKRTINILKAIARGCWILRHEWLLKSKEAGKWLSEEDYELTEFSPAVQQCRLQKQAFGAHYSMDIFENCGRIYIASATTPKAKDLKDLVQICKGNLTTTYRNASIIVGEYNRHAEAKCVKEMWILDSITFNKLKPLKNYLIDPSETGNKSPEF